MKWTLIFTEGVGAGAGIMIIVGAFLFLTRPRAVASAARRLDESARAGRSLLTGRLPSDYLDLCRAAGL